MDNRFMNLYRLMKAVYVLYRCGVIESEELAAYQVHALAMKMGWDEANLKELIRHESTSTERTP